MHALRPSAVSPLRRSLRMNPAWVHLPMARARRVLTAVSNGWVLRRTWARRSPPWRVASRVVARSSGSMPRRQLPVGVKGSQSIADGGCPPIEPCRYERSGLGVTLGQLTTERPSGQPPCALVRFASLITICRQASTPFALRSSFPLVIDNGVGLVIDDRLHEVVLVGEVVVHLRAADFRRHLDVFQGGARHPALMDQGGGLLHYSCPGCGLPWG